MGRGVAGGTQLHRITAHQQTWTVPVKADNRRDRGIGNRHDTDPGGYECVLRFDTRGGGRGEKYVF